MDFDNDGTPDIVSGSYDPGDLYLFRGIGNGQYAAVEPILDESGLSLVHHPKEFAKWHALDKSEQDSGSEESMNLRVATFGSWPAMVDWDADGDLDVLIGSFAGDIFLRLNTGTRDKPVYAATAIQVEADRKPLHVNMHAAPVAADWDADGTWDLVVGSGDGAVGWFRNVGSPNAPRLQAYRQLVAPASDTKFFEQNLDTGDEPTHGTRAQICVTDYNGDGKPDLIVGDYSDVNWLRDLSAEEQDEQARLLEKQKKMIATVTKLRTQFADDYRNEDFQKEMQEFSRVFQRLDQKRKSFFKASRRASYVWLFLRQDIAAVTQPGNSADPAGTGKEETTQSAKRLPASTGQLSLFAEAKPVSGQPGLFKVTVDILIKEGWHLYSDVPKGGAHRATTIDLQLPNGIIAESDWLSVPGVPAPDNPSEKIYTDFASYSRMIRVRGAEQITLDIVVNYEVCNKDFCLPVGKLKTTLSLNPE